MGGDGMSLHASERETTVTTTDADDTVRIWTAQRRHIGRMRRHPAFTEVGTGFYDGSEWAEFAIPADQWPPASGAKRKSNLTDEQKQAAAARLAAARGDS
jgi:hypothetical protein